MCWPARGISPASPTRRTKSNISIGPGRNRPGPTLKAWLAKATEHKGSWWPDWLQWLKEQDPTEAPARVPGDGKLKPIEDAPGSYVKVQA